MTNKKKDKMGQPFMCLLMIVKNESHIITETLEQLVGYLDYWVICDTGSTDNTKEIIKDFFAKHQKPGELHEHAWVNFGHNRTLAFQAARNKSKYVFVFDADDKVHGALVIPTNLNADAYFLKFGDNFRYTRIQIFRNNMEWAYRGVLHEFPVCVTRKNFRSQLLDGEYHIESRRLGSRSQDPQKYAKDAAVLQDAIDRNIDPDLKNRYVFYLAQSHKDAKNIPEAIRYYQMRVSLGGWKDECFYSAWQVGQCMENCSTPYTFSEISRWYLKAAEFCGHRGESLTTLGVLCYRLGYYERAVFYLSKVRSMEIPEEVLFCVRSLYRFDCEYPLALALNKLGRFQASLDVCARLLQSLAMVESPNREHEFYASNVTFLQIYNDKKTLLPSPGATYPGFEFVAGKDIYGYDVGYFPNLTLAEMIEKSKQIKNCNAFNTLGYFKDISILCADKVTIDENGAPVLSFADLQAALAEKYIDLSGMVYKEPPKSFANETTNSILNVFPVGIFIKSGE